LANGSHAGACWMHQYKPAHPNKGTGMVPLPSLQTLAYYYLPDGRGCHWSLKGNLFLQLVADRTETRL